MLKLIVNDKPILVKEGSTILQACESAGIQIPRFCYHERLSVAGNCRMCLVHVDKAAKPVASCAVLALDGQSIYTDTVVVRRAREGVMEFLLANHPLDCPICDQGGECDLQDQAVIFGNDRGRFYELKRAVTDKPAGPLIKTVMTRCIHCTRCVRFSSELTGLKELGTTGRGSGTEIGNYVSSAIKSVVSGNLIDLCPVGALTSKPYAFTARSWELRKVETIDTSDGMCSNISVHVSGLKVVRILPVLHAGINEEWIHDRARFSYDGLYVQRLLHPLIKTNNNFEKTTWSKLLGTLVYKLSTFGNNSSFKVQLGNDLPLELLYSLSKLKHFSKKYNFYLQDLYGVLNIDFRKNYLFNAGFQRVSETDVCLLVGLDLEKEMPLLALRLRTLKRDSSVTVLSFGVNTSEGLADIKLGNSVGSLLSFIEGKHRACSLIATAKNPLILVGGGFNQLFSRDSLSGSLIGNSFLNSFGADIVNFVHMGAGKTSCFELGLVNNGYAGSKLVGVGNLEGSSATPSIYFGTHGSDSLKTAELVVPGLTSYEKEGIYINIEGRPQLSKRAVTVPEDVRIDYKTVLSMLYLLQNVINLPEDILSVRKEIESVTPVTYNMLGYQTFFELPMHIKSYVHLGLLQNVVNSFYKIDSISAASGTMGLCDKELLKSRVRSYFV